MCFTHIHLGQMGKWPFLKELWRICKSFGWKFGFFPNIPKTREKQQFTPKSSIKQ